MVERNAQNVNAEPAKRKKNNSYGKVRRQDALTIGVEVDKIPKVESKIIPGSGVNSETGECAHHWVLETEKGGMSFGRCKKCGVTKTHGDPENPYR